MWRNTDDRARESCPRGADARSEAPGPRMALSRLFLPSRAGAGSCIREGLQGWFGEGNGTPLQYSCLGNPMDGGAWWAAVHGVSGSRTRRSDFTFTFHFHALEKEIVTHSSVLAWRIPGLGEPGGLPSMGSHRVGHDWSDLAAAAGLIPGQEGFSLEGSLS